MLTKEKKEEDDFIYLHKGQQILFRIMDNGTFECPYCKKVFIRIVKHTGNPNCKISQINIEMDDFKANLDSFREGYRLELGRRRKQRSRNKLIEERGLVQLRNEKNQRKLKSKDKLLAEKGPEQFRKEENERKVKSKGKLIVEKGPVKFRKEEN